MADERLTEIKAIKEQTQISLKEKPFKNLNTGEKDLLLETMAKMLGLIK